MRIYESPENENYTHKYNKISSFEHYTHDDKIFLEISKGIIYKNGENFPIIVIGITNGVNLDFEVFIDSEIFISEINESLKDISDVKCQKKIFDIAISFLKGEYFFRLIKQVHDDAWKNGRNELREKFGGLLDLE